MKIFPTFSRFPDASIELPDDLPPAQLWIQTVTALRDSLNSAIEKGVPPDFIQGADGDNAFHQWIVKNSN